MENMKIKLFNAIVTMYDISLESYKGLNDPSFIEMVCENIGMTEEEYNKLMFTPLPTKDEVVIPETATCREIILNLSATQKDDLYRTFWYEHVLEDVEKKLSENPDVPKDEEEFASVCQEVANRYVYNGDYDCNLSYWNNINSLIDTALENTSTKVFQFLYSSSEAKDGVGNITCKVTGLVKNMDLAKLLWKGTLSLSNANFHNTDEDDTLSEDGFADEEIDQILENFPDGVSEDVITAYEELIFLLKEKGYIVEDIAFTDDPWCVTSYGVA